MSLSTFGILIFSILIPLDQFRISYKRLCRNSLLPYFLCSLPILDDKLQLKSWVNDMKWFFVTGGKIIMRWRTVPA